MVDRLWVDGALIGWYADTTLLGFLVLDAMRCKSILKGRIPTSDKMNLNFTDPTQPTHHLSGTQTFMNGNQRPKSKTSISRGRRTQDKEY
ncbi:hypothetical protein QCA50_005884 [Cerrena zonata]|uniref:Uncharacterized protein n=1 Tax=Cerrena zonata TaxID=2478898 RepID=A0AAW0GHZ2_9APHY